MPGSEGSSSTSSQPTSSSLASVAGSKSDAPKVSTNGSWAGRGPPDDGGAAEEAGAAEGSGGLDAPWAPGTPGPSGASSSRSRTYSRPGSPAIRRDAPSNPAAAFTASLISLTWRLDEERVRGVVLHG